MTRQTANLAAQTTARRALWLELEPARDEAVADYIKRGVVAYAERGALRGDLCLLITFPGASVTLSEFRGLEAAGLIDANGILTPAGREAAVAAQIARAL